MICRAIMNRPLAVLSLSLALVSGCVPGRVSRDGAVQINLGKLLNARVVTTEARGRLQMADHSLNHGWDSVLITKSAMEVAGSGKLNPLPDVGFFPANNEHPEVQLAYGIVGGGAQVHQSTNRTEVYDVPVPTNRYAQLQLFFISAAGATPVSFKLLYADGSTEERVTVVTDFYFLPKTDVANWFVLAEDFGKVNLQAKMTEQTHHYIHGYNLNPEAGKVLRGIEVTKKDSGSVLNLFGVTGRKANHE